MNGKVVPIQVRLPFELVSIIGEHIQEKKELKAVPSLLYKKLSRQ